jgi:hypothetical protein
MLTCRASDANDRSKWRGRSKVVNITESSSPVDMLQ